MKHVFYIPWIFLKCQLWFWCISYSWWISFELPFDRNFELNLETLSSTGISSLATPDTRGRYITKTYWPKKHLFNPMTRIILLSYPFGKMTGGIEMLKKEIILHWLKYFGKETSVKLGCCFHRRVYYFKFLYWVWISCISR